jgi:phospholipase C
MGEAMGLRGGGGQSLMKIAIRILRATAFAAVCLAVGIGAAHAGPYKNSKRTRTPIKHLIVVIGENHSFDNVFATYTPPDPTQHVWNLLSLGIVNQAGLPGPNANLAAQNQATDTTAWQLSPTQTGAFSVLPQPSTTLNALPASLCDLSVLLLEFDKDPAGVLFCTDYGLEPAAQQLLAMGGTGQPFYGVPLGLPSYPIPDCRYPSDLPNGPYSFVGASQLNSCPTPSFKNSITPTQFTDNVGDPVHRFFQMWQQNDCSAANMTANNPSGCAHDLYTWVAATVGWQITKDGKPPVDDQGTFQGGISMGFYNMAAGDYPYFQALAQNYAINDNYHQFIMGGTGPNSQAIGTADVYYYTDSNGNPATPSPDLIENPDPQAGSNNFYTNDSPAAGDLGNTSTGGFVNCSDSTQPGVKAIDDYLALLPYAPFNSGNCASGNYYQIDNEYPSYDHLGNPIQKGDEFPNGPDFAVGPQTIPTIGDALSRKKVSWNYYGEGMDTAGDPALANELYCAICNPFQFSQSIMTGPLKSHLQDLDVFFKDVSTGQLPAVSFVKPDILLDSHPGTSTPPLFEAFVQSVVDSVQNRPKLWKNTAILITFDESGGSYDSGYVQPIDFFGDGPRTVMIAVSPFAKFGYVDHTYSDHASILKFIELNWRLKPLSARSRDNLPNPKTLSSAPYFPMNSPAIGDMRNMFTFKIKKK